MKPAPSVCFHKTKSHFTRCTAVKGVLRMLHRPSACEIDSSKNRWICPIVHLRLLISGQCIMYTGKKKKKCNCTNQSEEKKVKREKASFPTSYAWAISFQSLLPGSGQLLLAMSLYRVSLHPNGSETRGKRADHCFQKNGTALRNTKQTP